MTRPEEATPAEIERVARALCLRATEASIVRGTPFSAPVATLVENGWPYFRGDARAAIEALRSPEKARNG